MRLDGIRNLVNPACTAVTTCQGAGAAYIFTQSGNAWSQQAEVTASDPDLKKIALSRKEHLMEGAQLGGGDEILVGAKAKRTNKKKATRERVEDEDEE